jgi:hypothetical protein
MTGEISIILSVFQQIGEIGPEIIIANQAEHTQ